MTDLPTTLSAAQTEVARLRAAIDAGADHRQRLEVERNQWLTLCGAIVGTIPAPKLLAASEDGQKTVDYFKQLHADCDLLRGANKAAAERCAQLEDEADAANQIIAAEKQEVFKLRVQNVKLQHALADVREAICTGPADDVLWQHSTPPETTVDFITAILGDDWSYDEWAAKQLAGKLAEKNRHEEPEMLGTCECCDTVIYEGDLHHHTADACWLCPDHAPMLSDVVRQYQEIVAKVPFDSSDLSYDTPEEMQASIDAMVESLATEGDHRVVSK